MGLHRFNITYQVYLYEGSERGCDVPWVFSPTMLCTYRGTRTPGCIEEQALLLGWKQTKRSLTGTWEELLKKSTRKIANLPSRHTRRIWV